MPYCPYCGTENAATAKFCIHCGAALSADIAEQQSPAVTKTAAPATHQRVTITQSPAPARRRGLFFTHFGLWGSGMILVGFFTEWINAGYLSGKSGEGVTGLEIVKYASNLMDKSYGQDELIIGLLAAIGIILLSAIICFFYIIGVRIARGAFVFFKIVPLLACVGIVVYIMVKLQQAGVDTEATLRNSGDVWKVLGAGIYLTLIGSLLLAISRSRR